MGAGLSGSELSKYSAQQIGDLVASFGDAYEPYKDIAIKNGVSGDVLVRLSGQDLKELLTDFEVKKGHKILLQDRLVHSLSLDDIEASKRNVLKRQASAIVLPCFDSSNKHPTVILQRLKRDGSKAVVPPEKRRRKYSDEEKARIINMVDDSLKEDNSMRKAVAMVNESMGYDKITSGMVSRWKIEQKEHRVLEKRGRKANGDFESEVFDELKTRVSTANLADSSDSSNPENWLVYSNHDVKEAAIFVRDRDEKWKEDPLVKDLQFSAGWAQKLARNKNFYIRAPQRKPLAEESI